MPPQPTASGTPQPTPAANPYAGLETAIAGESPAGGTSGSTDLYGLGEWGNQTVLPGALPFPVKVGAKGGVSGNVLAQAFANAPATAIAQLQYALYLGGFYSSKTYNPLTKLGVLTNEDLDAFNKALIIAGKQKATVASVLVANAQAGAAAGITAARASTEAQARANSSVTVPNTANLEFDAQTAYESELGRKPTEAEAAAFAAAYSASDTAIQRANNSAAQAATTGGAAPGLSDKEATRLQSEVQGSATDNLTPYNGPDDRFRGDFVTADGQVVAPAQGPTASGSPDWVNVNPGDPRYGQGVDINATFAQSMKTLGSVATDVANSQLPPVGASGDTETDTQQEEDPSVAATNFARNTNPKAADAHDVAAQFQNFLGLIGSSFGGN